MKVKMVTGDNVLTARAIAKECGIISNSDHDAIVIEGQEFRAMSPEEQLEIVTGLWATGPGDTFDFHGEHYDLTKSPALPKPAQEDGVAIGLAIAFGDINQPDVTLVRLVEPNGTEVYRSIEKATGGPQPMQGTMMMRGPGMGMMMMGGPQPGGKPPKPPRRTFPAAGDSVRMELQREGQTIRFQVLDRREIAAGQ